MTESRLISRIVPYEVPELRGDWALSSLQNLWILISHVLLVMRYSELYFYIEEHYFEIVPQLVNVFFVESLHSVFIYFHLAYSSTASSPGSPPVIHLSCVRIHISNRSPSNQHQKAPVTGICRTQIWIQKLLCVDGTACTQQQPSWFLVFIPHSAV